MDAIERWEAVKRRDRTLDGTFYFGVITTGVYCKPSCAARRPLLQHVRFYDTAEAAERDGLRACLRCRPKEDEGARMRELCRYIDEHSDERITLEGLAARAGVSRFHLQRTFKAVVGVTPKQYVEVVRMTRLKEGLRHAKDVTEAVYEAGFGSSSRVYERADTRLGMTPKEYRQGGRGVGITWAAVDSPLGVMMIGATDRGICFLQFGDSREELLAELKREYPAAEVGAMGEASEEFREWIEGLMAYLRTGQVGNLPHDVRGTAFQMKVWNYLQGIPRGEVQSYAEVAEGIGEPKAVRAVARACGSNRVAIVIPCHRVIRANGELGGYRWGLGRKRTLLELERRSSGQPA
ncbi:MAG TPA: bifunctional DNA-binding transcriptional regulator/O6-methylguanine-DNA methyltransferase Ada [Candidatus Acidoferrales bacterium]|nr:bifunctional DNA-binding transcriptional regulator/O6-methylguanine-DNA methyltransferase Ada [Candidatus Acidoferrales bacterium]